MQGSTENAREGPVRWQRRNSKPSQYHRINAVRGTELALESGKLSFGKKDSCAGLARQYKRARMWNSRYSGIVAFMGFLDIYESKKLDETKSQENEAEMHLMFSCLSFSARYGVG